MAQKVPFSCLLHVVLVHRQQLDQRLPLIFRHLLQELKRRSFLSAFLPIIWVVPSLSWQNDLL